MRSQAMSTPPLSDSEILYRTIAGNLPGGGVWLFDSELRCLVAEGVLAKAFGRASGPLEAMPITEVFDADVLDIIVPRFERCLRGESADYETDFRSHVLWSHYAPLRDRAGQPLVMVLAFDITARKRTEQALRESERRYTALFENRIMAIAHQRIVTAADGRPVDYRFEKVNDAFELATGLKREEVVGRLATEVFPGIQHRGFDFIGVYGRIAAGGGDERFDAAFQHLGKWFSVYAYSPQPGECTAIFTDITAQQEAVAERESLVHELAASAAAAHRARAKLETVFNSIGDGISVFDADGKLTMVNHSQARINGYASIDEMQRDIGWYASAYELTLPSGQPLPVEEWPVSRVLRGESLTDFEARGRRRDTGQSWYFSFTGAPVKDDDGRVMLAVVVTRDITERKQLDAARAEAERRLRLAVSIAHLGFWEWDIIANKIFFSAQWKTQLGYAEHELPDRIEEWESRLHPDDRQRVLAGLALYIGHPDGDYRAEQRLRHRDGSYRWIVTRAVGETSVTGQAVKLIGTHLDVTELKLAEQRLLQAAQHDALTGLPNRALVFEYAGYLLAAARRNHGGGAFLFVDLDRFKPINDLHGHEVGDRVLKEVALRLKGCVRLEDLVGRIGGDEFVIVMPHAGGGQRAATVAQHVIDSIGRPFEIGALSLSISPSIGISQFPQHGDDADTLIQAADRAMYHAKHSGRANYQFYTPQLDHHINESARIEATLKRALDGDGLRLHYQPVIDMKSRGVVGVEALLRMAGDDGIDIGPDRFIPVAEAAGLIGALGEWVAGEACRQHCAWLAEGLPAVAVAINVSPQQFRERDFAARLRAIVDHSGIDPLRLQIEVTESTVMDSVDEAVRILSDIKLLGIKIALDDFGTGYSSLSRLGNLPLDKLKVDQSFVKRVHSHRASRAITDAVIALGRTLGLEVVGEGIESQGALDYLQAHDCDQAQGFFISHPLPAPDFAHWYRDRHPPLHA